MQMESEKETTKCFNILERTVQKLCKPGRIEGAHMLSLKDVCSELSISIATGRNWVKLGKLVPTKTIKQAPLFSKEYVSKFKKDIISGKNSALKSRRNKKFMSGNNIYNSYLSETSKNFPTVAENYPELTSFTYEYETGEDILGLLYISLKNIGNRKSTGSYYTPTSIVKKLCNNLFSEGVITSH